MKTLPDLYNQTVGEAIRITAQQYPAHIALQDNHGSYTYSQLLQYSAGISNTLLANNTAVGDRVVLLLNQGKAAVAAMIGVLDAGACFVPIDIKEPAERLQYIIQDCQPRCVITDSANFSVINNTLPKTLIINIDDISVSDAVSHQPQLTPDSAAYIFYTSGSTGNPKGVCQNHRNVLHFANTYATTLGIAHNDRLSMLYSMNFSASNMDIFSGLLRGATVCFYDLKNRGSADLEQWLNDEKITVLHTVPSVFRHLLNNTHAGHVYSAIRAIDLGGEAVYNSDIPLLKTFFTPECICFNHLAATEASVIAQHKIDTSKTYSKGLLPVGPAAEGMSINVVNAQGENAAIDEVGEIILESDFLSTGYWNLPEQSSKAFGLSINGKRNYRSGDLGFFDSHGNLNYVGRNDFRVKINGQTIELGEIEACLIALPDIDEAIVIAHQDNEESDKVLIAFYLTQTASISSTQLRSALMNTLPGYMIPTHFILRETFPTTSTGKIDRKKLLPETHEISLSATEIHAPETAMEKNVGLIFSSLLKTELVDKNKTFFEQGGNSLLAMNLVMLLEKNYQVDIPLELINNNASIANIALYLEEQILLGKSSTPEEQPTNSSLLVPLKIHDKPYSLFLVHGRDGHAMVSPHFSELLSANHSLYAIRARGLKHGEKPGLNIEGMAADYIQEIRNVQPEGPYYISGLCAGSVIALEMAKQLTRIGESVAPVILFDPPLRTLKQTPLVQRRDLVREMYQSLRQFKMEDYQALAKGLETRIRDGKIDLDLTDEQALGATAHVVIGMNIAMNTYLPHPYEGVVLILCSKERFENKRRFGDTLITGRMKHFIVGQTHDDVLDAKNPHFISALKQCLNILGNRQDGNRPQ